MKRHLTILLIVILITLPVLSSAGGLHFGIVSAVKDKVEEAKEKRDKDREKLIDHAPELSITSPITTASISGTFNITAEATDDKGITKVEFYINNVLMNTDTVFPYSYSWDTTQHVNGTYTIAAKAFDTANQTTISQMTLTIANDRVPTITITAPIDGATVSGTQTVTAEATDDKGISKVEFSIDNAVKSMDTTAPYSYDWDTTQYAEGVHIIKAVAFDNSNQTAIAQSSVTVHLDTDVGPNGDKVPIITITAPAEGATVSNTVNITADVNEDKGVLRVEYYIDDEIEGTDYSAPYSFSWNTTYFSSGTHIVKLKVYDTASQTSVAQRTVTVNNGNPPTIAIDTPAEGATILGTIDITVTAADDKGISKVEFYINDSYQTGDYSAPYSYTWDTTQYNNGSCTVKVKIYDTTNQTATDQHTVTINNPSNGWLKSTIVTNIWGGMSSIAIDSSNNPHIAFYDGGSGDLKYAKWTGSAWSIETVDSNSYVGYNPSLALDSSNNPHISYYDSTNSDLKYAKWTGSAWSVETVDSTGYVGYSSSLALDSSNNPHIAYSDSTNDDLKYAKWTGSAWSKETVDSTERVGDYVSIALDSSNYAHIAYYDSTNYDLKYAKWTGSAWSMSVVDSISWMYDAPSIKLDSSNNPHIAYLNTSNDDLKYAKWTGSAWSIETVDSTGYVGYNPSLALDSSNNPRISYYDASKCDLKYAQYSGSAWLVETVDAVGYVGEYPSLALDSNNDPHITYFDSDNGNIKYATK
ncbi:MAG: Ig-like domain-containing protein [bacterium]|nr:Ig-like domain-containing protein [bacterium]